MSICSLSAPHPALGSACDKQAPDYVPDVAFEANPRQDTSTCVATYAVPQDGLQHIFRGSRLLADRLKAAPYPVANDLMLPAGEALFAHEGRHVVP